MNPYLPLTGRPFRAQVGTRPLDPDEWIEVDDHRPQEIEDKYCLMDERLDDVLIVLPMGEPGARETAELLREFLPRRFPSVYERVPGGIHDRQLDRFVDLDGPDAFAGAGLLVQEDLCVMTRAEAGTWVLTAGSVCSPSHWYLRDKMGLDMAAIHEPVPYYGERLGGPTNSVMDRLTADRPVWRLNWTIVGIPDNFLVADRDHWPLVGSGVDLGQALFFRVERQTLRRLPRTGDILFTIRTYTCPLDELATGRPSAYRDLLGSIEDLPPGFMAYRAWDPILDQLRAWLQARVSA